MAKQRIGWIDYKTDYEEFSAKISDAHFPRRRLADGWAHGSTAVAVGHRAFSQFPWQCLLFHRPRSALGEKVIADKKGEVARAYMRPRRGPGRDDSEAPESDRAVHHAKLLEALGEK